MRKSAPAYFSNYFIVLEVGIHTSYDIDELVDCATDKNRSEKKRNPKDEETLKGETDVTCMGR
jgi:hypothetical protein